MKNNNWENEWTLLQSQFDSYEKFSLVIKLVNVSVFVSAYITASSSVFIAALLLIVWGQDAIWKTYQSRIESRLMLVEQSIATGASEGACQFNSQFSQNRKSGAALIREYLHQALRPTIAFPHVFLLLLLTLNILV